MSNYSKVDPISKQSPIDVLRLIDEELSQAKRDESTFPALAELQALEQWCCFKIETREGTDKPTKVPYHPRNFKASSKKISTWSLYEACVRACKVANRFAGKGFFFNGKLYSGIDLDDCVDEHGNIAEWAWEIIRLFDSYTEYSTNGTGVHIVVKGLLTLKVLDPEGIEYIKGWKNNPQVGSVPKGKLEVYSERRFFVVTGRHVPGTPTVINDRQEQLLSTVRTYFEEPKAEKQRKFYEKSPKLPKDYKPSEVPQDDYTLWQIIFREKKDGPKWERLYFGDTGDYLEDESAADFALASKLVWYTDHDANRVGRMMWQTGLARDKWSNHPTYLSQLTIDKAMQTVIGCYDPNFGKNTEPLEEEETITFEQVEKQLLEAIEKQQNAEVIYALADSIATLTTKEQASIKSIIERNKKEIPGFSLSSYNDCLKEARDNLKHKKSEERNHHSEDDGYSPYYASQGSMWMAVEPTERNPDPDPIQLSNFTGVIVADITTDDGAEKKRSYELETICYTPLHVTQNRSTRAYRFEVPVEELARCEWVDIHMGARACVTVGKQRKEHLAAAIKTVSSESVTERTQYAHTGWRKIDGHMVYLHNDGCVSEVSEIDSAKINHLTHSFFSSASAYRATPYIQVSEVSEVSEVYIEACVKLTGSLSKYTFPSERENIQQAIKASITLVDITQDTITMPLYAGLCRSVLGEIDLGIHLAGQTGQGKSQLAALIQQHFGSSMDALHLPGSWESTENALEMKLFQAKDAVFVADDFKPKGSKNNQDQLHGKADRVFRQIGNHQARGRLDANLNNRVERVPRCLLLSTGEDVPKGQSCQARMIALVMTESVTKGEAAKRLTLAQKDARDGFYAQAMAGYLEWLAPRIEAIQSQLPALIAQERDQLSDDGHSRAGTNTANLILGMKCFLQYACEMEAITPQEAELYLQRCVSALASIASEASLSNQQMKSSEQWKRLLASAISGNHAHLVTPSGDNPGLGYGWKKSIRSYTNAEGVTSEDETYSGGGSQIGWIDGDDIYLNPTASYAAILAEGNKSGDNIAVSREMLQKDLVKDKVLASTDLHKDIAHRSIAIRKRLQGSQKYVLHIKKETLFPNETLSDSSHSPHSPHSEGSKPAFEEDSRVSEVNHLEPSEGGDLPHSQQNQVPKSDLNDVPDEYQELFTEYSHKIDSLPVNTPVWRALENGFRNEPFVKDAHIARTRSFLKSGEERKIRGAIEAMRNTIGIKVEK